MQPSDIIPRPMHGWRGWTPPRFTCGFPSAQVSLDNRTRGGSCRGNTRKDPCKVPDAGAQVFATGAWILASEARAAAQARVGPLVVKRTPIPLLPPSLEQEPPALLSNTVLGSACRSQYILTSHFAWLNVMD